MPPPPETLRTLSIRLLAPVEYRSPRPPATVAPRCTFTNSQEQGRVVAVSVFGTLVNATRASDRVVGIMRERAKDLAPNPPRVTSGKAVVAAAA